MWHLFKSCCSVIWRKEVRNSTGSTEPQNVSYQSGWGVVRLTIKIYTFLSDTTRNAHDIWGKTIQYLEHSLGPCWSPLCPKDWGLGGFAPKFNDCSMSEKEARGSVSYEVWVLPQSLATIFAPRQHWLLIDSPTMDVWEPQPHRLRVTGRGHRNRQTFMGDDSLQISQSVQKHSGWQWGLPWNWRSQQPEFISSGLFFLPWGAIAWQHQVTECVKTPTRTHSDWIRDSNEKVFSKKQKNKLITFSKIRFKHSLEEITHICIYQRCDVNLRRSCDAADYQGINQDINVTKVWRRRTIMGEWCCLHPPNWVHFSNSADRN